MTAQARIAKALHEYLTERRYDDTDNLHVTPLQGDQRGVWLVTGTGYTTGHKREWSCVATVLPSGAVRYRGFKEASDPFDMPAEADRTVQ